jgi:hypothetical protein
VAKQRTGLGVGIAGFGVQIVLAVTDLPGLLKAALAIIGLVMILGGLGYSALAWRRGRQKREAAQPSSTKGTVAEPGTRREVVEETPHARTTRWQQSGQDATATPDAVRVDVPVPKPEPPPGSGSLRKEVEGLDAELIAGRDILDRCDDDHAWEPSPHAATEAEVNEWEQRVLLLLPGDFAEDFRKADPPLHASGDPTSDLAKRVEGKLIVLYGALMSRRQYLHRVEPEAPLTPDREHPYKGAP